MVSAKSSWLLPATRWSRTSVQTLSGLVCPTRPAPRADRQRTPLRHRVAQGDRAFWYAEGAWWFRSTEFGDEKDRVVLRANGNHTYFATDIAYHRDKIQRGFSHVINIWGADHHGRIKYRAGRCAYAGGRIRTISAYRWSNSPCCTGVVPKVSMSIRGGEFVTLRELREEVGRDAARFFYALRKPDQHMDFDLDLAKSQSSDNLVVLLHSMRMRTAACFDNWQKKASMQILLRQIMVCSPNRVRLICCRSCRVIRRWWNRQREPMSPTRWRTICAIWQTTFIPTTTRTHLLLLKVTLAWPDCLRSTPHARSLPPADLLSTAPERM